MNIRIAEFNDLDAIVGIFNQAISAGFKTAFTETVSLKDKKEWFKNHNSDKYPILVSEIDNQIVGYLTISPYRPGRMALRYTAEVSYFVHFNYHRQGVASKLLEHVISICPSLQIKTLIAILIESNISSIKILEKSGFAKWGYLPKVAEFDGIEVGHLYFGLRIENT